MPDAHVTGIVTGAGIVTGTEAGSGANAIGATNDVAANWPTGGAGRAVGAAMGWLKEHGAVGRDAAATGSGIAGKHKDGTSG